jgi:hypothetical protein
MKLKLALSLLTAAAAAAAPQSTIKMTSPLDSKIKMGGAVFNGYCASDVAPEFVAAYSTAKVASGGVVNEVTVVLKNVQTTCVGNAGTAPCATDAGQDRWPSFVCSFTSAFIDGEVSAQRVQGLRVHDISAGVLLGTGAVVKCDMPARENTDHDVTVSLSYHAGNVSPTVIPIPFTGNVGEDKVSISSTATPTKSPTKSPTAFPTAAPTPSPTLAPVPSGCKPGTVQNLDNYYSNCGASSEKPAQFFQARHNGGCLNNHYSSGFCAGSFNSFHVNNFYSTQLRTFSCSNSRKNSCVPKPNTNFFTCHKTELQFVPGNSVECTSNPACDT